MVCYVLNPVTCDSSLLLITVSWVFCNRCCRNAAALTQAPAFPTCPLELEGFLRGREQVNLQGRNSSVLSFLSNQWDFSVSFPYKTGHVAKQNKTES